MFYIPYTWLECTKRVGCLLATSTGTHPDDVPGQGGISID